MSSTNKTTNYDLSQFVGTDKPAWLTDYNQDMAKIDAGIDTAQDTATGADGKADANTTKIGDLTYLSTTAKNNLVAAVNEVDSTARSAVSSATTAGNTANAASAKADAAISSIAKINLTNFQQFTVSGNNINTTYNKLTVASNSDGSLCKVYGEIRSTYQGSTQVTYTTGDTGLRPESKITVQGTCLRQTTTNDGHNGTYYQSFDINTDGTISWSVTSAGSVTGLKYMFMACLIFVKDFGDESTPDN